jgi:hypothetical protein
MKMPLRRLAANLSLILSPASSLSNWAKLSRMFNVNLPIEVVVQNDCVTETKVTRFRSNTSTSLAKSVSERDSLSIL